MKKKLISKHDNYELINNFSKRAICVYSEELLMAKVEFYEITEDFGFHQHPHRQIVYVQEGNFLFVINGKEYPVATGDSLLIEGGLLHGCIPLEIPRRLLDIFTPVRKDFLDNKDDNYVYTSTS